MLQDKDIAKIQEIETFFSESWAQVDFFSKQIELFHFSKASMIFKSIKKSGVYIWDILKLLLVMLIPLTLYIQPNQHLKLMALKILITAYLPIKK